MQQLDFTPQAPVDYPYTGGGAEYPYAGGYAVPPQPAAGQQPAAGGGGYVGPQNPYNPYESQYASDTNRWGYDITGYTEPGSRNVYDDEGNIVGWVTDDGSIVEAGYHPDYGYRTTYDYGQKGYTPWSKLGQDPYRMFAFGQGLSGEYGGISRKDWTDAELSPLGKQRLNEKRGKIQENRRKRAEAARGEGEGTGTTTSPFAGMVNWRG